jgi:hypothetical protein
MDFTDSHIHAVEEMLCYMSPARIKTTCRKYDPNGEHDADWFLPLVRNLVSNKPRQDVEFDQAFWEAYDLCDVYTEGFDTFHFTAVNQMKHDIERLNAILVDEHIHVHTVPYIMAVFSNDRYTVRKMEERHTASELVSGFGLVPKSTRTRSNG